MVAQQEEEETPTESMILKILIILCPIVWSIMFSKSSFVLDMRLSWLDKVFYFWFELLAKNASVRLDSDQDLYRSKSRWIYTLTKRNHYSLIQQQKWCEIELSFSNLNHPQINKGPLAAACSQFASCFVNTTFNRNRSLVDRLSLSNQTHDAPRCNLISLALSLSCTAFPRMPFNSLPHSMVSFLYLPFLEDFVSSLSLFDFQ